MAKRRSNKAAKIREAFALLGHDARPKVVIASLAAKGIKVSSAQVSNVKAKLSGSTGGQKRSNGVISLEALLDAKKLVDRVGIATAQAAIGALAKLR